MLAHRARASDKQDIYDQLWSTISATSGHVDPPAVVPGMPVALVYLAMTCDCARAEW
jgi:hypothetical protein